jgi:hypothetical protein
VSKSLLLCILAMVCVAWVTGTQPAAGQEGQQAVAAQRYRLSRDRAWNVRPLPGRLPALLPGGPVQDPVLEAAEIDPLSAAQHLLGSDAGFLQTRRHLELIELTTWLQRGIRFEGDWSPAGVETALQGLEMTLAALGGNVELMVALLGVSPQDSLVYQVCAACYDTGSHFTQPEQYEVTFDSSPDLTSFLHETGHVVDYYLARRLRTGATWWSEVGFIGLGWKKQVHPSGEAGAYYLDTGQDAPHSEYSPREDFADTFAAWVLVENRHPLPHGWRLPSFRRVAILDIAPRALLQ